MNISVVNKWFANANRIVIDPRYRGAGIAANMLREVCRVFAKDEGKRYITLKTSMGAVNAFGEAAGFKFVHRNKQLERGKINAFDASDPERKDDGGIRVVYEYLLDAKREFGLDWDKDGRPSESQELDR